MSLEKLLSLALPKEGNASLSNSTGTADFRLITAVNLAWGLWASLSLQLPVIVLAVAPVWFAWQTLKRIKETRSRVAADKQLAVNDGLAQGRVKLYNALVRQSHYAGLAAIVGALWSGLAMHHGALAFLLPWVILNVAVVVVGTGFAFYRNWDFRAEDELEKGVVRGTHVQPLAGFRRSLARVELDTLRAPNGDPIPCTIGAGSGNSNGVIPLGSGLVLPKKLEPLHFLVMGSTGTGKSVLIKKAIAGIRQRGDMAVILDVDGQLHKSHARDGDVVWRLKTSEGGPKWNPLFEIHDEIEARAVAESIIPEGEGQSKEWNSYARTILTDAIKLAHRYKVPFSDFTEILGDTSQLKEFILKENDTLPSKTFFQGEAGGMVSSSLNIVATYAGQFALLPSDADFSIGQFVKAAQDQVLWVVVTEKELKAVAGVITTMFDLAASSILETDTDKPLSRWMIIDEFGTFNQMSSMSALLTKGRKYGARVILGMQSMSQIYEKYGQHGGNTLLANLTNFVVLRCPDPETAEYASKRIGDAQIRRTTNSHSKHGSSSAEHVVIEKAVLPSEILGLPDLTGFTVVANVGVSRVQLQI